MPDNVLVLDAARAAHMLGLASGLGMALAADAVALKSVFAPVGPRDVWTLQWLHRIILAGLALLWISGLYLLQVRTNWDPAQFSPKLITKLAVVVLLSFNALIIGVYALPTYARYGGTRFGAFPLSARLRLSAVAGLSLSCWLSALALGVFSQLKPLGFDALQAVLAPIFLAGLSGSVVVGLGAVMVVRHSGWIDPRPVGRVHSRMLGM